MVLITGDDAAKRAARGLDADFADRSIADPRAFLIESFGTIDDSKPRHNEAVDTWLNGILAEWTSASGLDVEELDNLIAGKERETSELRRRFRAAERSEVGSAYANAVSKWTEIKGPI